MAPLKKTPEDKMVKSKAEKIRIVVSMETNKKILMAATQTDMLPEHIVVQAISTGLSILASR
jgi:hypothetical protein